MPTSLRHWPVLLGTVVDLFATTQGMMVYLTRLLEHDDMSPC